MQKRIQQQITTFFKKWRIWTFTLVIWIIFLIRDYYATNILLWFGSKYGEQIEELIRGVLFLIPKDVSEWALLILVITIAGVLVYNIREERLSIKSETKKAPETQEKSLLRKSKEAWKGVIITEYEFPQSSLFGLGLKVENRGRAKIESISAELKYVVNTNTKDVPIITLHVLPWALGNHSSEYEPQTIGKGKEKNLVVLCWNKAEREIWFPTSSPESAPKNYNIIIDDGTTKARLRVGNDRTQIIGQNFYFEIHFNATINGKSMSFIWKDYLVYDEGAMKYDQIE